jgi:hypothetical protein
VLDTLVACLPQEITFWATAGSAKDLYWRAAPAPRSDVVESPRAHGYSYGLSYARMPQVGCSGDTCTLRCARGSLVFILSVKHGSIQSGTDHMTGAAVLDFPMHHSPGRPHMSKMPSRAHVQCSPTFGLSQG